VSIPNHSDLHHGLLEMRAQIFEIAISRDADHARQDQRPVFADDAVRDYAISRELIHWEKPVNHARGQRDGSAVPDTRSPWVSSDALRQAPR